MNDQFHKRTARENKGIGHARSRETSFVFTMWLGAGLGKALGTKGGQPVCTRSCVPSPGDFFARKPLAGIPIVKKLKKLTY